MVVLVSRRSSRSAGNDLFKWARWRGPHDCRTVGSMPIIIEEPSRGTWRLRREQWQANHVDPVISVGYAKYWGNASLPGVHFFGAIPYAQPPLGNLRFRRPQTVDESSKTDGIIDSRNWGPICLQQPATVGIGSEDCLTLNIWKPPMADKTSQLPVFVYIHSAQGFPMNDWIPQSNGSVIAVSIQYRLGLLGFLASSEVANDGDLNVGLLDQRAALGWINRNIGNFGGDPNHVTIAGESSGGADVVFHLLAYGGKQSLVQGAIAQSIGTDPIYTSEEYQACFDGVVRSAGCGNSGNVLSCLRGASLGAVVSAVNNRGTCKFGPVIDGEFVRELPSRLIPNIPLTSSPVHFMAGHTTNDGSIFVGPPSNLENDTVGFVRAITNRYTKLSNATLEAMIALYPENEFSSQWERVTTAFADTVFACQDWLIAKTISMSNSSISKNVYNYRFNTPDPVQLAAAPWKGVMHTSELFFLFDGTNSGPSSSNALGAFVPFTPAQRPLATETIARWTSFARFFDPNVGVNSTVHWPPIRRSAARLVLQQGDSAGTSSFVEDIDAKHDRRCAFWNAVGNETRI
ncbi:hypothetical protein BS47DRAFT_1377737 [Hydnum rufescens UP504]|uniref:Carboxylic ester hydrolase n=1 Tax=Hydnum rufescens UP504 TaxID=1448309 RepID=A0A9P6AMG4_9AGAM|nr:hypothetical protein BS47DRAFT_1377737 [Hydnum rufescens UP504]